MKNDERSVVLIDKAECLTCKHLLGELGTHDDMPCFKQDRCPAKFYRITVGGEILNTAKALRRAQDNNDTQDLMKVLNEMRQMDSAVENRIYMVAKGLPDVYDTEEYDEKET